MKIKFIVPALLALAFPVASWAAPAKSAAKKIDINPKARAIFARAVTLYHGAKTLSVEWQRINADVDKPALASLDFDRAGRVRMAGADFLSALIVGDGTNIWTLNLADKNGKPFYTRESVDKKDAEFEAILQIQTSLWLTNTLGNLLGNTNPLSPERVLLVARATRALKYRATLLVPQNFDGQLCDLVQVMAVYQGGGANSTAKTKTSTFWFARSDGRLMREQERNIWGQNYEAQNDDFQITAQTFNPKFAPDTFKFTPPKGAVLQKD